MRARIRGHPGKVAPPEHRESIGSGFAQRLIDADWVRDRAPFSADPEYSDLVEIVESPRRRMSKSLHYRNTRSSS
jgi:hypothetical protein